MLGLARTLQWFTISFCAALFCILLPAVPARSAPPMPTPAPPTDNSCRGCHGDSEHVLTLPSGETLSVDVDLDALDASPHSSSGVSPMTCMDCHQNATGYRYPHEAVPAQTAREFSILYSTTCEQCHFPHRPFHPVDASVPDPERPSAGEEAEVVEPVDESELPRCADCHGNHDVAPVSAMAEVMPARCLSCHIDQPPEWAVAFVAPRPGDGAGAEGFAGSTRCNGCHDQTEFTWRQTRHANIVQDAHSQPQTVVADFASDDPVRTFSLDEVDFVVGGRWKQIFLDRNEQNQYTILPAQWNVASSQWVPVEPSSWAGADWRSECGSCHVTGLDTQNWSFTEFGVGCESCHGPAAAHAQDPENVKPFNQIDDQVCGACHSRGASPEGHPFPATYRPGDSLSAHFTPTIDESTVWADGSAKLNHQQYMDWTLGNTMQQDPETSCVTCHLVHEPGDERGQLRMESNELCLSCHAEQSALVKHIPFHENAIKRKAILGERFLCTDCHMPKTASSAEGFDIHNHSLLQPNPEGSVEHGGLAAMPNACNTCHQDYGEDPEWAQQTISFASVRATPNASTAFGPGPTPTSPPPPTPLPRVGEAPEPHETPAPFAWLRYSFFAVIGLAALAAVVLVVRGQASRRKSRV